VKSPRALLIAGSLGALLAVLAGAFGAHVLEARLEPRALAAFRTGAEYQMIHSLALILLAALAGTPLASPLQARAGACFLAGIVVFSGSLYVLALSGIRAFGAVTPVGGVLFIAGWFLLILGAWRRGN
jgi:uncharacterized membrane protein YgdD (TMEM256/DUF423 family)